MDAGLWAESLGGSAWEGGRGNGVMWEGARGSGGARDDCDGDDLAFTRSLFICLFLNATNTLASSLPALQLPDSPNRRTMI